MGRQLSAVFQPQLGAHQLGRVRWSGGGGGWQGLGVTWASEKKQCSPKCFSCVINDCFGAGFVFRVDRLLHCRSHITCTEIAGGPGAAVV